MRTKNNTFEKGCTPKASLDKHQTRVNQRVRVKRENANHRKPLLQ